MVNSKEIKTFIFITGCFRSSTTLLSRVLNTHSRIQIFSDLTVLPRFHGLKEELSTNEVNIILTEIKERIWLRRNYEFDIDEVTRQLPDCPNSVELWYSILNNLKNVERKNEIVGEKVVLEWDKIPKAINLSDKVKIIHTVRDPRSVLVSWKKMTNADYPKYIDSITNCVNSMRSIIEFKKMFDDDKYQVFNYEHFINSPRLVIENIFNNLNIGFEDNVLNSSEWSFDGKPYKHSSMHGKIENISDAKKRSWKDFITIEEEFIFNKIFPNGLLEHFGYEEKRQIDVGKVDRTIMRNIFSDKFVNEGLQDLIWFQESHKRFPNDFKDPNTWMKPFFE